MHLTTLTTEWAGKTNNEESSNEELEIKHIKENGTPHLHIKWYMKQLLLALELTANNKLPHRSQPTHLRVKRLGKRAAMKLENRITENISTNKNNELSKNEIL